MRFVMTAFTNLSIGGDVVKFNTWYDEKHVPEVLSIPGFLSAVRYHLAPSQYVGEQPYEYLAQYEIETDNIEQTMRLFHEHTSKHFLPAELDISRFMVTVWAALPTGLSKTPN